MASVDSRYDIEIRLTITDRTTGQVVPEFSDTIQHYYNVPYEMMWQLQAVAIPALVERLVGMGEPIAGAIAEERAKGKAGAPGQNK